MPRAWLALWLAFTAAGCTSVTCGKGTKQVRQADGSAQCVPVDALPGSIPCNVDGGAAIVGGECVSTLTCGPNTMLDPTSHQCVGAGTTAGCPQPDSQHICVYGTVHHFLDDSAVPSTVHVAIYNPASLIGTGPTAPTIVEGDFTNGTFVFPNLPFSAIGQLGTVAVAVGDKTDTTSILCATGDQGIIAGQSYRIDGYLLATDTVAGWKPTIDVAQTGAYVAKFYRDAKPSNTNLAITETMKVGGVQLYRDGALDTNARYFAADLTTIMPTSTSTSATAGAAITVPAMAGQSAAYTGMGASITWEVQQGGTTPGVVFVARLHPNM